MSKVSPVFGTRFKCILGLIRLQITKWLVITTTKFGCGGEQLITL